MGTEDKEKESKWKKVEKERKKEGKGVIKKREKFEEEI